MLAISLRVSSHRMPQVIWRIADYTMWIHIGYASGVGIIAVPSLWKVKSTWSSIVLAMISLDRISSTSNVKDLGPS